MRGRFWIGLLGIIAGVLPPPAAWATNYRFVDEEGVAHYTNTPTHPSYQRFMSNPTTPPPSRPLPSGMYAAEIQQAANRYGLDAKLVDAVITVESSGNPWAVSPKGAQGLMQLMPTTAALLGVGDSFNPRQNIDGGVRHLRALLDSFGELPLALAAYNAGGEAVRWFRGIPPYRETQEYVKKILRLYSGDRPTVAQPATPPPPSQRIYRLQDGDGTIRYTNLPPRLPGL